MEKVKYFYDYPEQRRIAKDLKMDDKRMMAEKSGLSVESVLSWCKGRRHNARLMYLALRFQKINLETILRKQDITITFY